MDGIARTSAPRSSGAAIPTLVGVAFGRENNFNLLRMIAASMVMFSHSYALSGHLRDEPLSIASAFRTDVATVGVTIFFAISGFLIAQSLTRTPSLAAYAVARGLRILPGLALATLLCVAVGWAATTLTTAEYWHHALTWRFLLGTPVLLLIDRLPGVFEANPLPLGINGSLWTIPVEAWCYVAAAVFAAIGVLRRRALMLGLVVIALVANVLIPEIVYSAMPDRGLGLIPVLIGTFLFGAWLFVERDRVPVSRVLAIVAIVIAIAAADSRYFMYAYVIAIAYAALVFALHPRLHVAAYLRLGDYSYGTYVLAFPIQQLLVWRFGIAQPLALFALTFVVTLPLASLSWHYIEKPALALKERLRARRLAAAAS